MDGALAADGIDAGGAEDEVKVGAEGVLDRFDAAGAWGLKGAAEVALEADIGYDFAGSTVLVDDLGDAFGGQRADLLGFAA
jgi:hypothetical protein